MMSFVKHAAIVAAVFAAGWARADDAATYTWTGAGDGTTWSSAANWSGDGGVEGWPSAAGSKALFPAGVSATVNFDESVTFGTLIVTNKNMNLVFTAGDGVAVTCATMNAGDTTSVKTRHGGRIVFDGVKLYVSGSTDFRPNPGNDFFLKGGSEISVYKALLCVGIRDTTFYTETTLGVEDGSTLRVREQLQLGGAATLVISNATVTAKNVYVNGVQENKGGGGRIRFYGETPLLSVSSSMRAENASYTGSVGSDIEFFVPEGGYAAAPIQYSGTAEFMARSNQDGNSRKAIGFVVRAESPILATDELGAWPLVVCSRGKINPSGVDMQTAISAVTEATTLSDNTNTMTYARYAPASCLKITGAPREFGTGGYGVCRGLANGATETLTAPEGDSANLTCSGYRIYDVAADGTRTLVSSGSGTSCSYTHGTTRREVVWQWSRPDVYVTTTGAGEKTGVDWENACDSIQSGIDKYDYAVVHVAPGTYQTTATTAISSEKKGVEVRGEGTDPSQTVIEKTANATAVLSIAAALSTVTNLTITTRNRGLLRGVDMSAGLLSGCIVTQCKGPFGSNQGSGIKMTGGTVFGCVISNNVTYANSGSGAGIHMSGGQVENCRLIANQSTDDGKGVGVYMSGGTLRGCLIDRCYAKYPNGSGLHATGGTIENNTIVANYGSNSSTGYGVVLGNACKFRNNIVFGNYNSAGTANMDVTFPGTAECNCTVPGLVYGEGNIGDPPLFEDAAAYDYRLQFCPCVNGALRKSWMDAVFDLGGTARVVGSAPDIGCFERPASTSLVCSFTASSSGTPDLANVTLTSVVDGDTTDLVYYWRVIRADGAVYTKTGAEEANPVFALGAGDYTVELAVTNGAGKDASSRVENAAKVTASIVYVNENGSDAYPYVSRATGAHDLRTAFDLLMPGGTMYLAPGTYVISKQLSLATGIRLVSLEGPAATAIRSTSDDGFCYILVSSPEARVEGLTIVGGVKGPYYDGTAYMTHSAVEMSAGVLTNCVLRDIKTTWWAQSSALKLSGGEATDLLITSCCEDESVTPPTGIAAQITGGTLDRVIVSNCWTSGNLSSVNHGDIVTVKGGKLRNALIADCRCVNSAPVYIKSGFLENVTIISNRNTSTTTGYDHVGGLLVGGGTARNLILSQNWSAKIAAVSNLTGSVTYTLTDDREVLEGEGNKTGDPCFKQGAGRAWHLRSASPAVNAGLRLDWMTETSVDLDGKPRIRNRKPDLGCYECDTTGLTLIVR